MMGKKLLILAVISFACFGLAYAAVENIKVSGDITAHAITRDFSLGSKAIADAESFLLSQVRLRLDADLTENVSAVVRLINERLWDSETAANSDIDLDLGYVEMKEFLYQPLTIVIGRQPLRYGNGLIIGDPDTNQDVATALTGVADDLSLRKSFDAIKAILDFSPWVLDLVYAKINEGGTNVNDDVNLFGGNLAYRWNSFGGITEVYFWVFDNNRLASYGLATTQHPEAQTTTYVVGGRMQFNPIERLTLGLEGAYQFGDVNVDVLSDGTTGASEYQHLSAFAAQA
ncbi:MAG: alginate export family protein, partial [Candidatus Omnitrophica bacterium]|nr:alginate export family protein [Candidatus Omnitrophota bacterium]